MIIVSQLILKIISGLETSHSDIHRSLSNNSSLNRHNQDLSSFSIPIQSSLNADECLEDNATGSINLKIYIYIYMYLFIVGFLLKIIFKFQIIILIHSVQLQNK